MRWGCDGIYFVPLETAVSIETALPLLADKLSILLSGDGDPQEEVMQFLRTKRYLLILDNLEQFTDAAALVNAILHAAPHVEILATSREPLGLRAEQQLPLAGLPQAAASTLFVQSARQISPHFRLDEESETAVSRLCELVDGLPLALELAAGWVRVMDPAAILHEAEKSLTFLATADHDRPERHRSLQAIFNQTWAMLSPHLQQVLAQTAVFPSTFALSALQAILPDSSMLDMAVLLDKSLLRRADHNRYTLHPLIKQFAAARAVAAGGDEEWKRPFCRHYLALAAAQADAIFGANPQSALRHIRHDLSNIRWAWTWGIQLHLWAELDEALPTLNRFFRMTGQFAAAATALAQALMMVEHETHRHHVTPAFRCQLYLHHSYFLGQQGQYDPAIAQAKTALAGAMLLPDGALLLAQAHTRIGEWQRHQGKYAAAIGSLNAAIPLFNARPSPVLATAHNELGFVHLEQGAYAAARAEFQTALALYELLNDLSGTAVTLGNLGYLEHQQSHYDDACDYLERALTMAQEIGDRQSIVKHTLGLSWVALQRGDIAQTQQYQQEALAQATDIGYLRGIITARRHMADTCLTQNRLDEAENGYHRVLAMAQQAQLPDLIAHATGNLGIIYARRGEYEAAISQYEAAITLCEGLESPAQLHRHLSNLGGVHRRLGQYEEAQRRFVEALKMEQAMGIRQSEANTLLNMGSVCHKQKNLKMAQAYFEQALHIYTTLAHTDGISKAQGYLGLLHQENGEFAEAIACYEGSLAHSDALSDTLTAAVWRMNLAEIYVDMGDLKTAVFYNQHAQSSFRKQNSKLYIASSLLLDARLQLQQEQPQAAHLVLQEALALAEAVGDPDLLANVQKMAAKTNMMMQIELIEYDEKYARDAVMMWRASKEHALGVEDKHDAESYLWFLSTVLIVDCTVFLAMDTHEDKVVGLVAVKEGALEQLYIDTAYQRLGIGVRLLNLAKKLSPKRLQLYTFEVNVGAQRFYESNGFHIIGRGHENEENLPDITYEWIGDG